MCLLIRRKKSQSVAAGWGEKIRLAFRASGSILTDSRLMGPLSYEPEEESNYDTGVDLTEADFISDDLDTEQEVVG